MQMLRLVVSLLAIVAYNAAYRVTPLEKVITLLESLRGKVNTEGTEETKTYNTFACFCKDTMSAKTSAIGDAEQQKIDLKAALDADTVLRDEKDTAMTTATTAIGVIEEDLKTATSDRHAAAVQYAKEEVDLTGAVQALHAAILMLKAAKTAVGFVQLKDLPDTVRSALFMAQALLPPSAETSKHTGAMDIVTALLQEDPVQASTTYSFQADDIISTLESLKEQFKQKKTEIDGVETEARSTYDKLVTDKEALKTTEETKIANALTAKNEAIQRINTASADLTSVSAQLLDDQRYMTELSAECNEKAVLWDKRTNTRAEELNALTQAIDLMKGLPSPPTGSFLQLSSRRALQTAPGKPSLKLAQAHLHSNLSTQAVLPKRSEAPALLKGRRAHMVSLLKAKAKILKSMLLSDLVEHAAADPFAKIKDMIQKLIDKLLSDASSDATHKGWCDKEYSDAYMKRDKEYASIKDLNLKLEASEARIAKLTEEITGLNGEVTELNATLLKATTLRATEEGNSNATIATAKEGKQTVEQAITILDQFYKTAAKNASTSLLQKGVKADPEAGFEGEYAGMQSDSVGVIGMLEVVKADFERTITETEAYEAAAKQTLLELDTSVSSSVAAKTTAITERDKSLSDTRLEDSTNRDQLKIDSDALGATMISIGELDKACIITGDTAEERKIKREEEIEALKDALQILEDHGSA
mmetsp:Transcript_70899/g.129732  ORF Transcript_70899/g.129732 Transcript_70899/m.129732 type:complete len:703 (-) Transcript_70899:85-2193(-)